MIVRTQAGNLARVLEIREDGQKALIQFIDKAWKKEWRYIEYLELVSDEEE